MYTNCMNVFEHFPLQAHFSVDSIVYSTRKKQGVLVTARMCCPNLFIFPSITGESDSACFSGYVSNCIYIYMYTWNQDDPCLDWKLDLVLEGETTPKLRTNRFEL